MMLRMTYTDTATARAAIAVKLERRFVMIERSLRKKSDGGTRTLMLVERISDKGVWKLHFYTALAAGAEPCRLTTDHNFPLYPSQQLPTFVRQLLWTVVPIRTAQVIRGNASIDSTSTLGRNPLASRPFRWRELKQPVGTGADH